MVEIVREFKIHQLACEKMDLAADMTLMGHRKKHRIEDELTAGSVYNELLKKHRRWAGSICSACFSQIFWRVPIRMVYLYYISCLRYTILVRNSGFNVVWYYLHLNRTLWNVKILEPPLPPPIHPLTHLTQPPAVGEACNSILTLVFSYLTFHIVSSVFCCFCFFTFGEHLYIP